MSRIHELLAVEKTRIAAWNTILEETKKKFANANYFEGSSKSLKMIEDSEPNRAEEMAQRQEKPVVTTVLDTLNYFFDKFREAEDLQFSKNIANANARTTVMFGGAPLLENIPVDECLGLEARLLRIRGMLLLMPTLDASRHWEPDASAGRHIWITKHPDVTTKTEKKMVPVVMYEATDKHPAQVQPIGKDEVVGHFTTTRRSGAVTAAQKAAVISRIDDLITEVKKARQRANEVEVEDLERIDPVLNLILDPLRTSPTSN